MNKHVKISKVLKLSEIDEDNSLESDLVESSSNQEDSGLDSISEEHESNESEEVSSPSKKMVVQKIIATKE